jgi:hypothetical protein
MITIVAVVAIRQLKRENADLRQALVAKNTLLDQDNQIVITATGRHTYRQHFGAGDTLSLRDNRGKEFLTIYSNSTTTLDIGIIP